MVSWYKVLWMGSHLMALHIMFILSDKKWMWCMLWWSSMGVLSLQEGKLLRWLAKMISFSGLY